METQLQVFNSSDFGEVRTTIRDNEPWFVAADVCRALEIKNPSDALLRLDEDEKALVSIEGLSRGNDKGNIVNEPGLYTLVLGSRKPAAKAFKRWITHEVLPALRKTGRYSIEDESDPSSPVYETKRTSVGEVASLLLQLKQIQKHRVHQVVKSQKPRSTYANSLASRCRQTSSSRRSLWQHIHRTIFYGSLPTQA